MSENGPLARFPAWGCRGSPHPGKRALGRLRHGPYAPSLDTNGTTVARRTMSDKKATASQYRKVRRTNHRRECKRVIDCKSVSRCPHLNT